MELRRDANNWLLVLVSSSTLLRCLCRRQGKEWVQEDMEVKRECDLRDHREAPEHKLHLRVARAQGKDAALSYPCT